MKLQQLLPATAPSFRLFPFVLLVVVSAILSGNGVTGSGTTTTTTCIDFPWNEQLCLSLSFPACVATWNGVPCQECSFCGETEADAVVSYKCEVASFVATIKNNGNDNNNNGCIGDYVNVECGVGPVGCRMTPEDLTVAVAAFQRQQQQQQVQVQNGRVAGGIADTVPILDAATEAPASPSSPQGESTLPTPAPTLFPQGEFPLPSPMEGKVSTATNETALTVTSDADSAASAAVALDPPVTEESTNTNTSNDGAATTTTPTDTEQEEEGGTDIAQDDSNTHNAVEEPSSAAASYLGVPTSSRIMPRGRMMAAAMTLFLLR